MLSYPIKKFLHFLFWQFWVSLCLTSHQQLWSYADKNFSNIFRNIFNRLDCSLNIFYCQILYSNGVGSQVLTTLVTTLPLDCSDTMANNFKMILSTMCLTIDVTIMVNVLKFWTLFAFCSQKKNDGRQGLNSQIAGLNNKQGSPWSDCFFRSSLIWVCTVCLGLFAKQIGSKF